MAAVATVADALQFKHKYTSGVIAWAPEDNPSDAQIGSVVAEFKKTAWAAQIIPSSSVVAGWSCRRGT